MTRTPDAPELWSVVPPNPESGSSASGQRYCGSAETRLIVVDRDATNQELTTCAELDPHTCGITDGLSLDVSVRHDRRVLPTHPQRVDGHCPGGAVRVQRPSAPHADHPERRSRGVHRGPDRLHPRQTARCNPVPAHTKPARAQDT